MQHKVPVVNLPKVEKPYGSEIRACITTTADKILCGCDLSALEDSTKQHYIYFFDPKYVKEMRTEGFDPHLDIGVLAGLITEEERYKAVVQTWFAADNELTDKLISGLDKYNNIFMMADSGARGSNQQIKQLAGMRGLMADTSGHTIELPIKSNFREGLDVLEYFISAHGARKGLSDTALRTADSG